MLADQVLPDPLGAELLLELGQDDRAIRLARRSAWRRGLGPRGRFGRFWRISRLVDVPRDRLLVDAERLGDPPERPSSARKCQNRLDFSGFQAPVSGGLSAPPDT